MTGVGGDSASPTTVHDLRRVLGLLDGGAMEATYKPALLMALVDLSAEEVGAGHRAGALALPLTRIASRVAELYWPQVRPEPARDLLPEGGFYRLRQGAGEGRNGGLRSSAERRIPRRVHELRQDAVARGLRSALQAQAVMPAEWSAMVTDVAWALGRQPVPRLQRPSGARHANFERFMYDDSQFGERMTKGAARDAVVVLWPGVAPMLSDAASLLRPAIEQKWTGLVAGFNQLSLVESSLRAYLFGTERAGMERVRAGLWDLGDRDCFWCQRRLRSPHVDHVVPWSAFANDGLFNLVLTDPECNADKSDILVHPELLTRWVSRDPRRLERLAADLLWPSARGRSLRVAAAAYGALPPGVPLWVGRHQRLTFDAEDREHVGQLLADQLGIQ